MKRVAWWPAVVTLSLGNLWRTPPIRRQQTAVAVSAGIPTSQGSQYLDILQYYICTYALMRFHKDGFPSVYCFEGCKTKLGFNRKLDVDLKLFPPPRPPTCLPSACPRDEQTAQRPAPRMSCQYIVYPWAQKYIVTVRVRMFKYTLLDGLITSFVFTLSHGMNASIQIHSFVGCTYR